MSKTAASKVPASWSSSFRGEWHGSLQHRLRLLPDVARDGISGDFAKGVLMAKLLGGKQSAAAMKNCHQVCLNQMPPQAPVRADGPPRGTAARGVRRLTP